MTDEAEQLKNKAIDAAADLKKEADQAHEREDQRRFDENKKQIERLFVHVSDTIGKTDEHIRNDKEASKLFMENLEDVKEKTNNIEKKVIAIETDIKWLRESAEKEARDDKDSKSEMLPRAEFQPYKLMMNFIIATFAVAVIGGFIGLGYYIIQNHIIH